MDKRRTNASMFSDDRDLHLRVVDQVAAIFGGQRNER
jgi:hypothetical protein